MSPSCLLLPSPSLSLSCLPSPLPSRQPSLPSSLLLPLCLPSPSLSLPSHCRHAFHCRCCCTDHCRRCRCCRWRAFHCWRRCCHPVTAALSIAVATAVVASLLLPLLSPLRLPLPSPSLPSLPLRRPRPHHHRRRRRCIAITSQNLCDQFDWCVSPLPCPVVAIFPTASSIVVVIVSPPGHGRCRRAGRTGWSLGWRLRQRLWGIWTLQSAPPPLSNRCHHHCLPFSLPSQPGQWGAEERRGP